ncbi:class II fumarate hydratase [Floccifex sp.]|uniref:class II fumarate hydratase n=1 Tax=Floccifex sp. TaxID=2815810 RepID=UPI002A75D555|nr:class II fumarate hydratase [Floccifex sp.]MDD7280729.1 class II fumarate hydratase [Erysipelotrichaceae bacterium]MDY2958367.1 class II fumarate hydratase [Floccifex sp.]
MSTRIEKDCLGEIEVDDSKYWKSQTQRSLENFKIGTETMPVSIIKSFALLKESCASANHHFNKITEEQCDAIVHVCQEIQNGNYLDQFPLRVWQTGSGTQTNMNLNEVISMIGNEYAEKEILHPNDTVNKSQSSNDTFPAALHIMIATKITAELLPSIDECIETIKRLEKENEGIIKIGRTHLQDATPLYLSQELSGYRSMLEHSKKQILSSLEFVYELACGATAVGTGINCPKGFDEVCCSIIASKTNLPFKPDNNKFHALTSKDACTFVSGALKGLACNCMKIANDIRWLASGPRCGIGEIIIPSNEPGSSIMPGKVNPTQCEALTMVAVQVMGNDAAIGFAASQGNFELNVFMPLIAYNLDQSIQLLADAIHSFTIHCLNGLKPNKEVIDENLNNSLMLVTCLNPIIGYEKAGEASQYAYKNNLTLKEAILALNYLTEEEFDKYVKPENMITI